ncbi:MAG: hypothetical protein AAFN13_09445 [Bacteroidota bacterium]
MSVDGNSADGFGPIRLLRAIRYYRGRRPSTVEEAENPSWPEIETAIRRMDDHLYPIVQLGTTEFDDDDSTFNVVGGAGRWALFRLDGSWKYSDPRGGNKEVRLWQSDQGYFCQEREVIRDIKDVLLIVQRFYETATYGSHLRV